MGHINDAQVGVSVSLPFKFENIHLIISLLDLPYFHIYVSGLSENPDEIIEYDTDMLDELSIIENIDDFKAKYKELNINKDLIFHFIYVCTSIYAKNVRYRSTCCLFNDLSTPQDYINNIQKGVELFKIANVPDEYIKIGNTIYIE